MKDLKMMMLPVIIMMDLYEGYQRGYKDGYYDGYYGYTG